ncbi:hypothetical protein ML243_004546 [Klebsiella pneumoniae]|nr:hypothetical protein [Klebsiella pneumoniae]HBC8790899.1 hypothetical protein [Citrobacter braakii]
MRFYKFVSISLVVVSTSSFAGGGSPSWRPSVDPINCIVSKSSNSGAWSWNDSPQCNDVINHGYARGVKYTGKFIYQDGTAQDIASIITPRTIVKYEHYGKKIKAMVDTSASWQ